MDKGETGNKKGYISNQKAKRYYFKHFPLKDEIKQLLLFNNFVKPTIVQTQACEITLEEGLVDLCIIIYCFNGAGKTLSFLIPILNSINPMVPYETYKYNVGKKMEASLVQPQALIVVPTEALMEQVYSYLVPYSKYLEQNFGWKIKIGRWFKGGEESGHIIVGMIEKTKKTLANISHFLTELKWVVFDECDDIKEKSQKEFTELLNKLSNSSTANFIVCSATGNTNSQEINFNDQPNIQFRRYIQEHIPSKNVVELDIIKMLRVDNSNMALTGVSHYYLTVNDKVDKLKQILKLFSLRDVKNQMIIFFNKKETLKNVYREIVSEKELFTVNASKAVRGNINVGYIHGDCGCSTSIHHTHSEDCDLTKSQRVRKLRNKDYNVMLATDAIGRGIDVRTVTLVINFDEPRNKDGVSDVMYIHRAGRTGRYTDTGVALTFTEGMALVNMVSRNQKVTWNELKSLQELVIEAEKCYISNDKAEKEQLARL